MYLIKILLVLLFLALNLFSNEINLSNGFKKESILHQTEIYLDKTKKLTIEDIKKLDDKFSKVDVDIKRYGYSPKFNVWIKFKIKNNEQTPISAILEFESALASSVEFYDETGFLKRDGLMHKSSNRKSINPIFDIKLDSKQSKTYYLKASSHITSLTIKLNLYNNEEFFNHELIHQSLLSLFFGAMIVLALYNLSIYFFTKDISYLYYVGYIFTIVIHHLLYVGFANIYILNHYQMAFAVKIAPIFIALPVIFLALFSKNFLNLKRFSLINKILNLFIILLPISILVFIVSDSFGRYRNILAISLMCYLFFITLYSYFKGEKQANLILLGWGIILLSGLIMYFASAGVFNFNLYNSYLVELGFVTEALIFSMALANRIKQFQEEKQQAQDKLIETQKNTQKKLELLVTSRTQDLKKTLEEKELLLKELNHRVKNNMQTIISLIRLQNDEIDDKKINDLLSTIQNRIGAMSHLHELLYKKDNTTYVDAYDYFERIVSEIKDSYLDETVEIIFDINSNLNPNNAVYCGLILNELISNSFKHAFNKKQGKIEISLSNEKDTYTLIVKDNGKGYDKNIKTNSLGLILINTLATKQLGAQIDIDSINGVSVKIIWRDKNDEY
ncbi:MAG: 7TM diverse intracellular signaling domain-containing protein [Halarcobacter sp.]